MRMQSTKQLRRHRFRLWIRRYDTTPSTSEHENKSKMISKDSMGAVRYDSSYDSRRLPSQNLCLSVPTFVV